MMYVFKKIIEFLALFCAWGLRYVISFGFLGIFIFLSITILKDFLTSPHPWSDAAPMIISNWGNTYLSLLSTHALLLWGLITITLSFFETKIITVLGLIKKPYVYDLIVAFFFYTLISIPLLSSLHATTVYHLLLILMSFLGMGLFVIVCSFAWSYRMRQAKLAIKVYEGLSRGQW